MEFNVNYEILFFLMLAGFVASFIDSIVGGGGLISLPALLWAGMPPAVALGTNKMSAVMGAFTSTIYYLRSGKIDFKILKYLFPITFFGSMSGVYVVSLISSEFLRPLVVVMLILVTIYSLFRKDWGGETTYSGMTKKRALLASSVFFAFGFYDGFFGPGTGSFMLFFFLCMGFDFIGSAANARILNFASGIAATISFAYLGLINYVYALPMGLVMILGAYLGTRVALTNGSKFVRPLFIVVTVILIGRQLIELFK